MAYLTQRQVAERCQVSVESVRKWRYAKRLNFINLGHRSVRISEEELDRFLTKDSKCESSK